MNNEEINIIRDASFALREHNIDLAFKLISLIRYERPSSHFIHKAFMEMKGYLGIKLVVIIGNCQIEPLTSLLKSKSSKIHVIKKVTAHLYGNEEDLSYYLRDADYILTQKISEKFAGISTNFLQQKFGSKVITYPTLFYKGFHPDWMYLPKIRGIRLKGPMHEYHNQIILDGYIKGNTIEQTLEDYLSAEFNSKYKNIPNESMLEFKKRELGLDIKMSDYLELNISRDVCFHTMNHPKKYILNEEANRILYFIELEVENNLQSEGECLNQIIKRLNPIWNCGGDKGECSGYEVAFQKKNFFLAKGKKHDNFTMIGDFYAVYERSKEFVDEYIKLEY